MLQSHRYAVRLYTDYYPTSMTIYEKKIIVLITLIVTIMIVIIMITLIIIMTMIIKIREHI